MLLLFLDKVKSRVSTHLLYNIHISSCAPMLVIQINNACRYHSYTCSIWVIVPSHELLNGCNNQWQETNKQPCSITSPFFFNKQTTLQHHITVFVQWAFLNEFEKEVIDWQRVCMLFNANQALCRVRDDYSMYPLHLLLTRMCHFLPSSVL